MADIARADVAGLIPTDYSNAFLEQITASSAALSSFNVMRVGTKVTTLPVIATLPTAGFVTELSDSSGVKPTSDMTWDNKTITVEEVAVIIPIHENVLADATIDLWSQIRPAVGEAFGAVIDDAIFYGNGKPASWRDGLIPAAATAGQSAAIGTGDDVLDAFNVAFGYVEASGFDVNQVYSGPAMKARLRGLRNATTGEFIYTDSIQGGTAGGAVYGANVTTVKNGVWNDAACVALVADRRRLVVALREDLEYKLLTEATVGGINLAERDMVALRVKMRLGWEVQAPVTRLDATPVPYATVLPGAGGS